jgi:hypothetical protein
VAASKLGSLTVAPGGITAGGGGGGGEAPPRPSQRISHRPGDVAPIEYDDDEEAEEEEEEKPQDESWRPPERVIAKRMQTGKDVFRAGEAQGARGAPKVFEGWLLKKAPGMLSKDRRRWFVLHEDGELSYHTGAPDAQCRRAPLPFPSPCRTCLTHHPCDRV